MSAAATPATGSHPYGAEAANDHAADDNKANGHMRGSALMSRHASASNAERPILLAAALTRTVDKSNMMPAITINKAMMTGYR